MGRRGAGGSSIDELSRESRVVHRSDDRVECLFHFLDRLGEDVVFLEGGCAFAAIRLLEDALVTAGETAPAGLAVLCADALHLEPSAYSTCACSPLRLWLWFEGRVCRVVVHHGERQGVFKLRFFTMSSFLVLQPSVNTTTCVFCFSSCRRLTHSTV